MSLLLTVRVRLAGLLLGLCGGMLLFTLGHGLEHTLAEDHLHRTEGMHVSMPCAGCDLLAQPVDGLEQLDLPVNGGPLVAVIRSSEERVGSIVMGRRTARGPPEPGVLVPA